MSIINDALKKAQVDLKKSGIANASDRKSWVANVATETAIPASPSTDSLPKQSKRGWYTLVLFEICAFCIIVGFLFIFQPQIFNMFSKKNSGSPNASLPLTAQQKMPLRSRTKQLSKNENAIVLNGIMSIENKQVALINDEIYERGDYINHLRIIKISAEEVELIDGERTIFLNVHNKRVH